MNCNFKVVSHVFTKLFTVHMRKFQSACQDFATGQARSRLLGQPAFSGEQISPCISIKVKGRSPPLGRQGIYGILSRISVLGTIHRSISKTVLFLICLCYMIASLLLHFVQSIDRLQDGYVLFEMQELKAPLAKSITVHHKHRWLCRRYCTKSQNHSSIRYEGVCSIFFSSSATTGSQLQYSSIHLPFFQVSRHERRQSQIEILNETPFYPTEEVWKFTVLI